MWGGRRAARHKHPGLYIHSARVGRSSRLESRKNARRVSLRVGAGLQSRVQPMQCHPPRKHGLRGKPVARTHARTHVTSMPSMVRLGEQTTADTSSRVEYAALPLPARKKTQACLSPHSRCRCSPCRVPAVVPESGAVYGRAPPALEHADV